MKKFENTIIIGIDHGFGNIKTASHIFPSGVKCDDELPAIISNLLIYDKKYYTIGVGRKKFNADKFSDSDYYAMTLAAIAEELSNENITDADVHIAAGVPLSWVKEQRKKFSEYLMQNENVKFSYKGVDYNINIVGVDIFPQGFSAVASKLYEFKGINMLCDIGNGTINVMYINDKRPDTTKCFILFAHKDKKDGNIYILIVGKNTAALTLAFAKDSETVINPEFKAEPQDDEGTLIKYIEEIDTSSTVTTE